MFTDEYGRMWRFADRSGSKDPYNVDVFKGAMGGIFRKPTRAVIGESGPEAVIPLSQANAKAAGVGGLSIVSNITVNGPGDPEAIAQAVERVVKDQQTRRRPALAHYGDSHLLRQWRPISTHTLAAAAFEILDDFDKHGPNTGSVLKRAPNSSSSWSELAISANGSEGRKIFLSTPIPTRMTCLNFTKCTHRHNMAATEKYGELTGDAFLEAVAFRCWFIIRNPELILEQYRDQVGLLPWSKFTADMRPQYFEEFSKQYAKLSNRNLR